MKERRASQKLSSKSIMDPNQNVKCKIVVVGDSQCGKTALLHIFAKDCFPEVSVAGWGCGRAAGKGSPSRGGFPWFSPFIRFSIYIYCSCNLVPLTFLGLDNLFDVYLFMDFFVLLDTL